jgi:hypothetical protein
MRRGLGNPWTQGMEGGGVFWFEPPPPLTVNIVTGPHEVTRREDSFIVTAVRALTSYKYCDFGPRLFISSAGPRNNSFKTFILFLPLGVASCCASIQLVPYDAVNRNKVSIRQLPLFIFYSYSLHVSAPMGHPQVRYTIDVSKDYSYYNGSVDGIIRNQLFILF